MPEVIQEAVTTRTPAGAKIASPSSVQNIQKSTVQDSPSETVVYGVYFLFGLLEVLLVFRFVLRITGANPGSEFVRLVYEMTHPFLLPFLGIFPAATAQGAETTAVFEPSTLVAIAVYAILSWGVVKLIAIFLRRTQELA